MEEILNKLEDVNSKITEFSTKSDDRISKIENLVSNTDFLCDSESREMKNFGDFIRGLEMKSLSSIDDESGGYTIVPTLYKKIISNLNAQSSMRILSSIETISSNALDILFEKDDFNCIWEREGAPRGETETSKFLQKRINAYELYAQPKATQKLLDDAEINIASWLIAKLTNSFLRAENKAFIEGDGDNKPKGILSYGEDDIERTKVGEEGKISMEDLLDLMNLLDEGYLSKASFLMHRSTLLEIQKLKDHNDRFLWQPNLVSKHPGYLFGIPVYTCTDMPRFEAGKISIILADFKEGYKIVDRSGINIMRDPFTEKPFVKFYSVKRVGGDVVNNNAIKLLQC